MNKLSKTLRFKSVWFQADLWQTPSPTGNVWRCRSALLDKKESVLGENQAYVDESLQTFSLKGQTANILGLMDRIVSIATIHLCPYSEKSDTGNI